MALTRGAQRLLELLESYARHSGRAFPFQRTLAERLGVSEQMVRRNLLELKREGLQVKKRGQTSAVYLGVENLVEKLRSELRSGLRSEPPIPLVSVSVKPEKQPARKPPSVEKTYRTPAMPPMTITSPAGRVDPNPEFYRIQAILRARRGAIESARDPEAYLRAILRAELAS